VPPGNIGKHRIGCKVARCPGIPPIPPCIAPNGHDFTRELFTDEIYGKKVYAEHDGSFSSELLSVARGVVLIGIGCEQSGLVSNLPIALKFEGYFKGKLN
jgi:hypothetical protein